MEPLPLSKWDKTLQAVVDDMNDRPLNIHALLAHQPALLHAWWNFRNYIVSGGDLSPRESELVVLRVAAKLGVWYEWGSHVDRGLQAGIPLDEIEHVSDMTVSGHWSEREALLLQAVDQLVDQHRIDPQLQSRLGTHYTTAQLLDIVAIQGAYVSLACMINTWEPELDQRVSERLPGTVTRSRFAQEHSAAHGH